ncbi:ABC transporter ATP-binding protein [Leucobacter sp. OH2974_COT-288]|uniref:Iron complex transport system ATP-binding protein n=1 Tax=Canibacter oris TaxID=1365628 RepID=A0A840DFK8_9MICO|nr:ABC transporter ATP-binding protein [Canibacter oris]MBB4072201.1 iron complex transport system ATP-binding protein [Canibacter oris]RRD35103.1 ABC transporter ATP-binding protein [Leucobacter sp. OH2974_COT-288]
MKIFAPTCPLLQHTLTLEGFGAYRAGRALSEPLNIHLLPGTVLGVVGPNGAGKSSLLAAIAQAGVQHFGSIRYNGANLTRVSALKRSKLLGMLTQNTAAPPELTVAELVQIGARASRQTDAAAATHEALAALGIADLATRRCGTLSGGQLQLAQLARVLAQNTPIMLFDEPTSALDLLHQKAIEQTMRRLGNEGKIVIAALHDLNIALNACTQILLLDKNGTNLIGSPLEVLHPDMVHTAYGVTTNIYTTARGRKFITTE